MSNFTVEILGLNLNLSCHDGEKSHEAHVGNQNENKRAHGECLCGETEKGLTLFLFG